MREFVNNNFEVYVGLHYYDEYQWLVDYGIEWMKKNYATGCKSQCCVKVLKIEKNVDMTCS